MDLRRSVGPSWLVAQQDRIALPAQAGLQVDVVRFRHLLQTVEEHGHEPYSLCDPCVVALTQAANLYHGDFLAGFSLPDAEEFDLWRTYEAENLQRDLSTVLEKLAYVHGEEGRHQFELAIAYARRWLALDPLHEPAQRTLMQLYAWADDRTAALHQYHECVRVLAAELDVEPEPETVALYETIRRNHETSSPHPVTAASPHPVTHNLPAQATPFIGRRRELKEIAERLADEDCRLLTIVGPGGMGKTRLAIEAALAQTDAFQLGVHLVDLAPVGSADLLATAILRSLEAPQLGAADPRQRLCDFLQSKEMLLLLDNFEHLLDTAQQANSAQQADADHSVFEGVELLPQILHAAPNVKLLVTSRERLNLREEWLQPLQGLEVPPAAVPALELDAVHGQPDEQTPDLEAYDATRLFVLCMQRLHPKDTAETDTAISTAESLAIASICRLLEGMPLGIELAAAWTRALPLMEIQGEMERSLHFLSAPLRDVPARHRSMHAVFDHSWNLLSQEERSILRRMSVFRDGCTRQAAEEVAEASLAHLSTLVDKSWLRLRDNGRYGMHELMRQYCEEKLENEHAALCGETAAQVRRRHCTYFGAYVRNMAQTMNYRREAIHEIMAEFGNLQAAWHRPVDDIDIPAAFDICMAIFFASNIMGWFRFSILTLETAAVRLEKRLISRSLAPADEAGILRVLAFIRSGNVDNYIDLGLPEEANTSAERLCALVERMEPGEDRTYWHMLSRKALQKVSFDSGDFDSALVYGHEMVACVEDDVFRCPIYGNKSGRGYWLGMACLFLARTYWMLGDYAEAESMFERSVAHQGAVGEQRHKAIGLGRSSGLSVALGNYNKAEELARQGLRLSEELDDPMGSAAGHLCVGQVLVTQGHYDRARVHLQQAVSVGRQSGGSNLRMDALSALGQLEFATGHPGAAKRLFEEAIKAFATVGTTHTNHMVAVWLGLGWTALAREELVEARTMFGKALCAHGRAAVETMDGIAGMGRVLRLEGRHEEAVELFALVAHHPFTAHALRQQAEEWLQDLEHTLPPQTYNVRVTAGGQHPLDEVVEALVSDPTEISLISRG